MLALRLTIIEKVLPLVLTAAIFARYAEFSLIIVRACSSRFAVGVVVVVVGVLVQEIQIVGCARRPVCTRGWALSVEKQVNYAVNEVSRRAPWFYAPL